MPFSTFGELFCGAGGLALGLSRAGFRPVWAIDADPDACATYRRMIGDHVLCAKVEGVDFRELPRVDGLAFGFPCNDFSIIGKRKGTQGYYGGLYREAVRGIDTVRPTWFVAENVPGMMSSGGAGIMQEFAAAGPGYNMSVHLYRFEEYGVPQRRHRVIAVGIRSDLGLEYLPPAPTHTVPVSAREALAGVQDVPHNNEPPRHNPGVVRMLESIPPGGNCWHPSVPDELRTNTSRVRISIVYRRLHPDEPSYTIVTGGGGGTYGYHWEEPRALTNRERARLQSFPDDFVFEGGIVSVRKQIGMAVPPLGAQAIGEALMKTLNREPYESVPSSL